ncbi:MAG: group II truncated hemoglobin [Burkholderiales bacterium]|nr:group II truncated hemoglobin [Burkholderiales bacterium]
MSAAATTYETLGGAEKLRALVDRFYELMDAQPEYYAIRKLHPQDLSGSAEKLYLFLSGWLGGPPLYQQKFGHPFLRARHLPFAIGETERDLWLACMRQAMQDAQVDAGLSEALANAFYKTADHMRNQPEG